MRIILCYYYLEDRAALTRTIADNKDLNVPVEITRWLGRKSFEEETSLPRSAICPGAQDSERRSPS